MQIEKLHDWQRKIENALVSFYVVFRQVSNNDLRTMLGDKLVSEVSRAARDMLQEVLDYREMKATKARTGSPPALVSTSPASDGGPLRKLPAFPCVMSLVRDKMTVLKFDPEQNTITEASGEILHHIRREVPQLNL